MTIKKSKTAMVLARLQRGWSVTGRQAMDDFDLYRLSSAIKKLRKRGYDITTTMVRLPGQAPYGVYKMARKGE